MWSGGVQASTGLHTDGCKVGPIKLISQRPHKTITDITVSKLGISTSSLSIAIGTFKHGMKLWHIVSHKMEHNNIGQKLMKKVWKVFVLLYCRKSGRRHTGDMLLNLASPAGLPAAFPLDAADFANIAGTDRLCTQNVKQNLQCGSSAQENPPGDLSKLQIFDGISWEMLWWKI